MLRKRILTVITAIAVITTASVVFAQSLFAGSSTTTPTLFWESFESGNFDNWNTLGSGSWSITTNGTKVLKQSATEGFATAVLKDYSWGDFTASAKILYGKTNGSSANVGINFRYQDAKNHYKFVYVNDEVQLIKKVNDDMKVLAKKSIELKANKFYNFKVKASGSDISCYIDEQLMISKTDSTYKTGKLAINAYKTVAEFDNIKCTTGGTNSSEAQISSFTANPQRKDNQYYPGEQIVFNWVKNNSDTLTMKIEDINGNQNEFYVDPNGPYTDWPKKTSTYTLTAFDKNGNGTSKSIKINIVESAELTSFTVSPFYRSYTPGQKIVFNWVKQNSDTIKMRIEDIKGNTNEFYVDPNGPYTDWPRVTSTYTLTVYDKIGNGTSQSIKITVNN